MDSCHHATVTSLTQTGAPTEKQLEERHPSAGGGEKIERPQTQVDYMRDDVGLESKGEGQHKDVKGLNNALSKSSFFSSYCFLFVHAVACLYCVLFVRSVWLLQKSGGIE